MTDTTFKFRFVNEIAGAFVLLAVAALAGGIFLAGRAQGLFEPRFRLRTVFSAEEGTYGLKKGSEVRILDMAAGSVTRIGPAKGGAIEATLELKESYHDLVRMNSAAMVKKTLVLVGDSYVDISVGSRGEPPMPDGNRIPCTADKEITEQASTMIEELRTRGLPTLERLNIVLEQMPAFMEKTGGAMRKHEDLVRILLSEDVRGTMRQFRDSLREAQVLFEAMQRHWALRGYVEEKKGAAPESPVAPPPARGGI